MLKCAILKEIFYQDSISGIEKIAYEKNKGRNTISPIIKGIYLILFSKKLNKISKIII